MASLTASALVTGLQKPFAKRMDPADSLKKEKTQVVTVRKHERSSLGMPDTPNQYFPFMRLSPEIRNNIYPYLLSTKHTRQDNDETEMVDFLRPEH